MTDYTILKEQLSNDLKHDIRLNTDNTRLAKKIKSGAVNYVDLGLYSKALGDVVSQKIAKYVGDGIPDEELEEFSSKLLIPTYKQMQRTTLGACKSAQLVINKAAGIGLIPVDVALDESRTIHIQERFEEAETFDEVAFLTNSNVARSISRGAVNDSIRANANAQERAGLGILLSRYDGSGCCDWCSSVTGTFTSFDSLPDGFWAIHRGCSCTIDYKVGRTQSQLKYLTDDKGRLTKVTS